MIDSLMYLSNLEAVGIPRKQAEAQVRNMVDMVNKNLATREDLSLTKTDLSREMLVLRTDFAKLRGEFGELRGEFGDLRGEFGELRGEFGKLRGEFAQLAAKVDTIERRLTIRLGGLMLSLFTIGIAIIGLMLRHA